MIWQARLISGLILVGIVVSPYHASSQEAVRTLPMRKLAPGVLTVIPSEPKTEETFQKPIPPIAPSRLNWEPYSSPKTQTLLAKASTVVLRHNIWNLEFAFKPMRIIYVDIPQSNGKMRRKLVWYMVYRVKNKGKHLKPVPIEDQFKHKIYGTMKADAVLNIGAAQETSTIRCFPHFSLQSREHGKEYLDRVIPVAIRPGAWWEDLPRTFGEWDKKGRLAFPPARVPGPTIQEREIKIPWPYLHNTVEISRVNVPVSTETIDYSVWGVVMWEDVEPQIDFFSVYVQGLTNAYKVENGRHLRKTLQLNFWRPGDRWIDRGEGTGEHEIRYGVPAYEDQAEQAEVLSKYGLKERVDHLWVYR